jgi:hypothetical protein
MVERPKAEALGYLEAKATAEEAKAKNKYNSKSRYSAFGEG